MRRNGHEFWTGLRCSRVAAGRFRFGHEAGSSVLEVALLMPVLLLILVGAAELGRVAYASIEVKNAAYAGAAFGAQNHGTALESADIAAAAARDGANVSGLTATSSLSCTCSDGTSITCTNAAAKCISPARIVEFVEVDTTASVSPLFAYPGISTTWVLHGDSTLRVVQ